MPVFAECTGLESIRFERLPYCTLSNLCVCMVSMQRTRLFDFDFQCTHWVQFDIDFISYNARMETIHSFVPSTVCHVCFLILTAAFLLLFMFNRIIGERERVRILSCDYIKLIIWYLLRFYLCFFLCLFLYTQCTLSLYTLFNVLFFFSPVLLCFRLLHSHSFMGTWLSLLHWEFENNQFFFSCVLLFRLFVIWVLLQ